MNLPEIPSVPQGDFGPLGVNANTFVEFQIIINLLHLTMERHSPIPKVVNQKLSNYWMKRYIFVYYIS